MPQLDVPYFNQRANRFDPDRSCNTTAVAMIMAFYGIVGDGSSLSLPDQVFVWMRDNRLSRYSHADLVRAFAWKGLRSRFTTTGTMEDIENEIDAGRPVAVSGFFTPGGHIVVVSGYDRERQLLTVCDPYGEYFSTGYVKNDRSKSDAEGQRSVFRYSTFERLCTTGARGRREGIWMHRVNRI